MTHTLLTEALISIEGFTAFLVCIYIASLLFDFRSSSSGFGSSSLGSSSLGSSILKDLLHLTNGSAWPIEKRSLQGQQIAPRRT